MEPLQGVAKNPGTSRWLLSMLLCTIVTGCSSLGVKPWERGRLSQPAMQFNEQDLSLVMDDHFYFSKEGFSGGRGFAGGGCGCN